MNNLYKIISVAAFALSLIAILLFSVRAEPMSIDLFGVTATTLSFLVVILIGYQVFSVVNFDREKRKIQEIRREFKQERKFYKYESYSKQSLLHLEIAKTYLQIDSKEARMSFEINTLKSILYAEKSNSYKSCNHLNKELKNIRVGMHGFTQEQTIELNEVRFEVDLNHLNEIGNFNHIIEFLY